MKSKSAELNVGELPAKLSGYFRKLAAYKVFIFFLVVATLYGFIVWQINVASNAPASQSEETAQTTPQPRIDPATIQKIQNLQDNSVGVKSLFGDRQNPFQE